jgi:hypothetical protein
MKFITYNYYKRKHQQGIGGVLQGEILAYLLCIYFDCIFIRSNFFYYKGHDLGAGGFYEQKWKGLFKFLGKNNINITKKAKIIKNLNQLKNKSNFAYNIPFGLSLEFLKILSKEEKNKIFENFRNKFWKKNKKLEKKKNITNIVLHLRNFSRGDTIFGRQSLIYQIFSYNYGLPNNNPEFYTNWYSELVKKIIKDNKLKKKKLQIYICSTGKIDDFFKTKEKLEKLGNTKIRLNFSSYDDFKLLISADYFIMAQSSFSYLASLINKNKKYIRNGFRQPLPPDVQIVKDYHLSGFSFIGYLYNNFTAFLIRIKIKIINILFKKL